MGDLNVFAMLATIHLDHQASLQADEIEKESLERRLTAEMKSSLSERP